MRNSRQVWVPREGTRLNRFSKANETAGYVDLTNDPLVIDVPGTEVTAARMNSLEDGVDAFYRTLFSGLSAGTLGWFDICSDPSGNLYAVVAGGDIYKSTNGGTTFNMLGITTRNWAGICSDPTGNIYATVSSGDIYKSTNGGTTFNALGLTSRLWQGICSDSSGSLYAAVYDGDIYKSIDGGTTFTALGLTTRGWTGICSDPSGNLYATVYGGGIYKSTDSGITFTITAAVSGQWSFIDTDPAGNVYAALGGSSGNIYKSTDSGTTFTTLGLTMRSWGGVCSDLSGNIYATVHGSDIYKSSYLPITPSSIKTVEITTANVTEADNRFSAYRLTGALTGNREYILPTDSRSYRIICDCTGSYYVHVKTASGTGVYLAPGDTACVYCDGVNILSMDVESNRAIALTRSGGAQSITAGSDTLLTLDTVTGDGLSEFSAGASSVTLKNAGKYAIRGSINVGGTSLSGEARLRAYLGSTSINIARITQPSATANNVFGNGVINASAGDVLTFYGYVQTGTGVSVTPFVSITPL